MWENNFFFPKLSFIKIYAKGHKTLVKTFLIFYIFHKIIAPNKIRATRTDPYLVLVRFNIDDDLVGLFCFNLHEVLRF